jgi:hypothetical protein
MSEKPKVRKPLSRQLEEGDKVAIIKDRPVRGVKAGDVGFIVLVYDEGLYEVNFIDSDGVEFGTMLGNEELTEPDADTQFVKTK